MSFGPAIDALIDAFKVLPGVGRKSAQRMALHLLERDRKGAMQLSETLAFAMEHVGRCASCNTFSETEICPICSNPGRDQSLLCIVESPSDLLAIEQAHHFKGVYFVLMGSLSPLDGRGPHEIGIPVLIERLDRGETKEVILATNPTMEGEATAHYVADLCLGRGLLVTRLAQGIPLGGELGYIDGGTLSHAFSGRKPFSHE